MSPRTLHFLAQATGGTVLHASPATELEGISTDTRTLIPGQAFLAVTGEKHDAHQLLGAALERGAGLLIVQRDRLDRLPAGAPALVVENTRRAYGQIAAAYRADFSMPVVAIAGSNGKTSTKEMTAAVLGALGSIIASEASYNNDIGVPTTLLRIAPETRAAVIEVGTNHPGELAPLIRMAAPAIGVLTSIGREHLEFFETLEGVIREEGSIAEELPADGTLIVNGDTPGLDAIIARTRARVVRCGTAATSDWRISNIRSDATGSDFDVLGATPEYCGTFRVNVLGHHMVLNATLALAVAALVGVPATAARAGLAACRPARMRMNLHDFGGIRVLDDAYNANPDSMIAALRTLNDLPCAGRRVAVLGQMGELGAHAETAHEEVGRAAARSRVDHLIAVGHHAERMVAAARAEHLPHAGAVASAEEAANAAIQILQPGDHVLVKASRSARLETVVDRLRTVLTQSALPTSIPTNAPNN